MKLALKMALYRYSTRHTLRKSPLRQTSRKNERRSEACARRRYLGFGRGKYNEYTPEERAQIGKFAAEHGPAKAVRHFSKLLSRKVQLSIHTLASIFSL